MAADRCANCGEPLDNGGMVEGYRFLGPVFIRSYSGAVPIHLCSKAPPDQIYLIRRPELVSETRGVDGGS